jgi:hypothetical protein
MQLDMQYLSDRDILEPWKFGERKEKLFILQQQPKAVQG